MKQPRRWNTVLLVLAVCGGFVFGACGGDGEDVEQAVATSQSTSTAPATQAAPATPTPFPTATPEPAEPGGATTIEPAAEIARPTDTGTPAAPTPAATATPVPPPPTATATSEPAQSDVDLAPELGSLDEWYNSEPVSLAELRGEPVLLVFWASY